MIDRHAVGRADFILAAIAPADRTRLIVCDREMTLQRVAHRDCLLGLSRLAQQRIDRNLDRREAGIEPQHDSLLVIDHVLVVCVEHEREHRAIHPQRGLDHPRPKAGLGVLVEISQVLAAELRVLIEVVAAALGHALQLAPSERIQELDVGGAARIMRQFIGRVFAGAQMLALDSEFDVPVESEIDPVAIPLLFFLAIGTNEELHLHLLELAGAENEILGGDFVAERFALLRDAERQLDALRIDDVLEVRENSLRGFRAQIDNRRGVFHRTHEGFEHQVEIARRRQLAAAFGAAVAR